jgi:6-pyruvoyltetrahydropterin/6-carboxytetrahydropterin synthase
VITISRTYRFEAAHYLPNVPPGHKCGHMHGHSYELVVEVSGYEASTGWVMDFADVDAAVSPLIAQLDHSTVNDQIDNPTSENICLWFALHLQSLPLSSITVSETPRSRARWVP